jgi:rhodanese-related sulfurtransferase
MSEFYSVEKLYDRQPQAGGPVVIDVRSEEEYAAGHIPGALHIPASELASHFDELPAGRPVVPY